MYEFKPSEGWENDDIPKSTFNSVRLTGELTKDQKLDILEKYSHNRMYSSIVTGSLSNLLGEGTVVEVWYINMDDNYRAVGVIDSIELKEDDGIDVNMTATLFGRRYKGEKESEDHYSCDEGEKPAFVEMLSSDKHYHTIDPVKIPIRSRGFKVTALEAINEEKLGCTVKVGVLADQLLAPILGCETEVLIEDL